MSLNLASTLRATAAEHARATAIVAGDQRVDYRTLESRSLHLAGALRELGVRRGEHVALLLPNVPEFTVAYFACHAAAAPVVPLNVLLKAEEIAYHLQDSSAVALVAWAGLLEQARPAFARVPSCRHLIVAGRAAAGGELLAGEVDLDAAERAARPVADLPDTAPDDTAVLLYTSGTTGRPKGAELSHFNLFYNAEYMATRLTPLDASSVCLLALPLFHSFGQTVLQNAHVIAGGSMVLMPRFEPGHALRLMREHAVTYFAGVPTMYFALLHCEDAARFDARHLRYCVSGGAPMPVEVMQAFETRFGVSILEGYGLSETSPVASFNVLDRPRKPGSVGLPIRGVEFRLVDRSGAVITEPGVPGEIWIKGHNVMKGYWNAPEATAAALTDGWLHTGDVATVDDDGFYFIVDRIKDVILRGGFNVYPREVEEVLYAHPAVTEAAVVGVPDERAGEEVVAFVACAAAPQPAEAELIAWCKERLAAYKYPRRVRFLPELPKGPTGKILKRALRDR